VADEQASSYPVSKELDRHLPAVPLLSLHLPMGWDYEPITIVTAQSVTGTGLFSDVGSFFTDVFGLQSGMFREKLKDGEDICKKAIRLETLKLGGHGVLGIDVDYAEVGGTKAMLMVSMTGTAVRLKNLDILSPDSRDKLARGKEIVEELQNPPCEWCGRKLDPKHRTCTSFSGDHLVRIRHKVSDPICVEQMNGHLGEP
jgi:uncharacterized protein YbjQ (UPF0145 family)